MSDPVMFDRLGNLVSTIGSREFGSRFYDLLREVIDIEECTVFSFSNPANPQQILVECDCEDALRIALDLARDYVSGGFRDDPNVRPLSAGIGQTISVVDRDAIVDPEYRRRYYDDASVAHELVMMGDVDGTVYYTSLYRRDGRAGFADAEVESAKALVGFIVRALHRHSQLVAAGGERLSFVPVTGDTPGELRERTLEHLREVLVQGPHKLSAREAEVCAGIVMGYSTLAISLNCSISPNTVATHRKRAYAKLGISSQNELFTRYFATVRRYQEDRVG